MKVLKVLIVDDCVETVEGLAALLEFQWPGVQLLTASTGDEGARLVYARDPDLVLLDVGLPGRSGFEVLRDIRRVCDVPVILLTGRKEEIDVVRGLELGADAYVSKPFSNLELLARIRVVLRRAGMRGGTNWAAADFRAGALTVAFQTRDVRLRGESLFLTPAEFRLLHELVRNAGRLVSREWLVERVWGDAGGATDNNLKALVSRLRLKLGTAGDAGLIDNERGVGYRFVRPPDPAARAA
jgi:two-component system, OmpR family, response regulator VicR